MSHLKITDFEILNKLGNGSYSTVFKGQNKSTKEIFAIKCIDKTTLSKSACDNLITEIRLLKKLKHKHIVEMRDFLWDEKHIYIVLEYCNSGDLLDYIRKKSSLSETTCKIFLSQLALALKYMRENEVSHFDLKPQNLLLHRTTNTIQLKVADFGFAQHMKLGQENTSIKGSPLYMAPEILLKNCYTASADLWSIGVILYECLFGKAPYSSKSLGELLDKIKTNQKIEIPRNAKISPEAEDLLSRLLKRNPAQRITFDDFFSHDFLDLKHSPSDESLAHAISVVTAAVDADTKQNYREAYYLYCEALQFFVPIIQSEPDATKKQALRSRTQTYLHRAEEIKNCILSKQSPPLGGGTSPQKSRIEAALTPSLTYQHLHSLSASSTSLKNALEVGRQGELYAYEGKYQLALDSYRSSLGCLVTILANEPKGTRRDLMHQQITAWMREAESIKSILTAKQLENGDLGNNPQCCLQ